MHCVDGWGLPLFSSPGQVQRSHLRFVPYVGCVYVFDNAVNACQKFVLEKMGNDGIDDKEMITLFALEHDMNEFAKILGM